MPRSDRHKHNQFGQEPRVGRGEGPGSLVSPGGLRPKGHVSIRLRQAWRLYLARESQS